MKLGVENMLEVYMQDKKRTKDLETQLDTYNTAIGDTVQRIESIRTNAGMSYSKKKQEAGEMTYKT